MDETLLAEWAGVVVGALMTATGAANVLFALSDLRGAESPEEHSVGRRFLASGLYRFCGKFLLWSALVLLVLARPGMLPVVRRFLVGHPLVLFGLVIGAMTLFTLNNVAEFVWRRQVLRQMRLRARLRATTNRSHVVTERSEK